MIRASTFCRILLAAVILASGAAAPADTQITHLGDYYCWGLGFTGGRANDAFYIVYQHLIAYHQYPIVIYYAKYVPGDGFVTKNEPLLLRMPSSMHPFLAYWGDKYHVGWLTEPRDHLEMVDAPTFAAFQSLDAVEAHYDLTATLRHNNPVPSAYGFDNTRGWVLYEARAADNYCYIRYIPWTADRGWTAEVQIDATRSGYLLGVPTVLTLGRAWWRVYYLDAFGTDSIVKFVETQDGGQTWAAPRTCVGLASHYYYTRLCFARYGDNFWIFLIDPAGDAVAHFSTDGENWSNKQTIFANSTYYDQHGCLLNTSQLLSTMSDVNYFDRWGSGIGDQYAAIHDVPRLEAYPVAPRSPSPADGKLLPIGTQSVELGALVSGFQSYDVSFYWDDGSFIGEEKNLRAGDVAQVRAAGLENGRTYAWYAIARGATGAYWGGPPAPTHDEVRSPTWTFRVLEAIRGDLDCDGEVTFGDVTPFVLALTDPDAYRQAYPECVLENGDCNGDGKVDFGDINPFVDLLSAL